MTPMQTVAASVRRCRHLRGWSLADLSEQLTKAGHPISLSVLSRIELGERRIDVNDLVALSAALDVTIDHLMLTPAGAAYERALQAVRAIKGGAA